MQCLLAKFVLILTVCGLTFGQAVTYLGGQKHPDVNDKCFLTETKEFIELGGTLEPIGICRRYTCLEDYVVQINHCPRYMVPENCEVSVDNSQSYPNCCPKVKCPYNDESE